MAKPIRILLLVAFLLGSSSALATSYRLDFGGQTSTGTFGGYFILDYSTPDDNPDPLRGDYTNAVTSLVVQINGITYDSNVGGLPILTNVQNSGSSFGDYFGIGGGITNANGEGGFIGIQFQNLDGTALSSDALPTELAFTDFDPFDPLNTNSTGAIVGIPGGGVEFVALAFAELHPVPLPAALWLFASAAAGLFGFGRRRA